MPYKKYYFYSKEDKNKEPINSVKSLSRLEAAKFFATIKQMTLKNFLSIFSVNK